MQIVSSIPALAFIQNLSGWEIILIVFAILLLFGAKRLPDLAKSVGKSMREFKKAVSEVEDNLRDAVDQDEKKSPPETPRKTPPSDKA